QFHRAVCERPKTECHVDAFANQVDTLVRQLEVVLGDYRPLPVPVSLLIVPERAAIARVRLLVDFIVAEISKLPGIRSS
ncbi:hypothetical protein ACC734_38050, partial [Rhizobium ruizarguesonis]